MFCKACSKVNIDKTKQQLPLQESFATSWKLNLQEEFDIDLYDALISANIPLAKLMNPSFKIFLEKYTNEKPCTGYLVSSKELQKTNGVTVLRYNFNSIKDLILNFGDSSSAIEQSKLLLTNKELSHQLNLLRLIMPL
ncbi:hypothetical protein FQR65_LT06387 [Abscondita terminalis]|nr:hypothetical protein FQR65_LT06387 [Abscondita terminalis]